MLQMAGAVIGMMIFTQIAVRLGRKTAFGNGFSAVLPPISAPVPP